MTLRFACYYYDSSVIISFLANIHYYYVSSRIIPFLADTFCWFLILSFEIKFFSSNKKNFNFIRLINDFSFSLEIANPLFFLFIPSLNCFHLFMKLLIHSRRNLLIIYHEINSFIWFSFTTLPTTIFNFRSFFHNYLSSIKKIKYNLSEYFDIKIKIMIRK